MAPCSGGSPAPTMWHSDDRFPPRSGPPRHRCCGCGGVGVTVAVDHHGLSVGQQAPRGLEGLLAHLEQEPMHGPRPEDAAPPGQ